MKRKPVVGVTGPPCSGKSHAARLLASGEATGEAGELVQADELGHAVLSRPGVATILRARFGDDLGPEADAPVFRRRIAARVFSEPEELAWLEGLVHPLVIAETDRIIAAVAGQRPVIVEAALLFAAGMDSRCDWVLALEADFAVRLRRAEARGWDRGELERRERRQIPLFANPPAGVDRNKIITVRNDADDGRLGERISAAWRRVRAANAAGMEGDTNKGIIEERIDHE